MKKGDIAGLKMEKVLCKTVTPDTKVHESHVLDYDERQECISFCLGASALEELSLDAIYSCVIYTEEGALSCTGRVCDRYNGEQGKTVRIHIENGFCKIDIKSLTNK